MNNHRFIHFHYPTGSQVLARSHRFSIYSGKFSDRMTFVYLLEWEIRWILFARICSICSKQFKSLLFLNQNGELCCGFKQFKKRVVESATVNLVNDRKEVTGPTCAATNWEVNRKDGFCTHAHVGDPVRWVYSELQ